MYRAGAKQIFVAGAYLLSQTGTLKLMYRLCESDHDQRIVEYLRFGWPINHDGRKTTISLFNHPTATHHGDHVLKYLQKEYRLGCLLGPFATVPWQTGVAVSPMATRPKRNSTSRRIIMDLSWPRDGTSVK